MKQGLTDQHIIKRYPHFRQKSIGGRMKDVKPKSQLPNKKTKFVIRNLI